MKHLFPVTLVLLLATFRSSWCQDFGDAPTKANGKIIEIRSVAFEGATLLRGSDREEISRTLMHKDFETTDLAASEAEDRTRSFYLERGYFRASVESWTRILGRKQDREWVEILVRVSEGNQYRLKQITTKHNTVFTEDQVRSMIPLHPGDIFRPERIAEGFEVLRKAYGREGYVNFTSVPDTIFSEADRTITLQIDMDEGRRFTFGDAAVFGLVPAQADVVVTAMNKWKGQPYSFDMIPGIFEHLRPLLPPCASAERHIASPHLYEQGGTASVILNFQDCDDDWLNPEVKTPAVNCCPR